LLCGQVASGIRNKKEKYMYQAGTTLKLDFGAYFYYAFPMATGMLYITQKRN
jgi:hypothetical protein